MIEYRHPKTAKVVHRILGPLVAFVVALWDAVGAASYEFRRTFERSYHAIRSYHADQQER